MKTFSLATAFLCLMSVGTTVASELDPQIMVPQEIIVREDASGNRQVFKVSDKKEVSDADSAIKAIDTFVTAENQVTSVLAENELDRTTSTEAWYYYYTPRWYGYNYGYYYGGYNYYYRPYYNYSYGYYNYYYYRCW